MRYLLFPALAACLSVLPAQAITGRSIESCASSAGDAQVAQSRCYQVANWTAPDLLRCQQIGSDRLGRPIWLCCD